MVEKNYQVTLEDEMRGITLDAGSSAFLDWLCSFAAIGDDGRRYWFGCSPLILKLENIDLCNITFCAEAGEIIQDSRSIYKIAKFPSETYVRHDKFPGGTHKIQKQDDRSSSRQIGIYTATGGSVQRYGSVKRRIWHSRG